MKKLEKIEPRGEMNATLRISVIKVYCECSVPCKTLNPMMTKVSCVKLYIYIYMKSYET